MKKNNLEELKNEYMNITIPNELDPVVKKELKENDIRYRKILKKIRITAASVSAALIVLIILVNSSPAFASALSKVHAIGAMIKVITFKEYVVNKDKYNADIKVPSIQGMKNKNLEDSLNEKYLAEDKKLYNQFMVDMKELEKNNKAHIGVSSGYEVKTDTNSIFSVKRYVLTVAGSSNTQIQYDTIDKKKQVLITLPSLFKDDSYIDVISANIISQMREQMKSPENGKIYWIDNNVNSFVTPFKKISKDQSFYINKDNKLVISFDQGEVGPAVMGTVEFVIPTKYISNILVGNEYIK